LKEVFVAKTPDQPLLRFKAVNRNQMLLRAVNVDKLIGKDHPARTIWNILSGLDLEPFKKDVQAFEGQAGRPPFHPQVLVGLWIYALKEGVNSAREIAARCEHHPAYQWLTGMKPINYHTISDFRTDNGEALKELFVQLLGVMTHRGLITLERVAHDGTKIRANASSKSFRRRKTLKDHLDRARRHIEHLESCAPDAVAPRVAKARERAAREKQERIEGAIEQMKKVLSENKKADADSVRVSSSDPEARIMKVGSQGFGPAYNVQITTDAESGIIVAAEVSQSPGDANELIASIARVRTNCGRLPVQMIVDGGFTNKHNIEEAANLGIDLIGSLPERPEAMEKMPKIKGIAPEFYRDRFRYDAGRESYICPAGAELRLESRYKKGGSIHFRYRARPCDCSGCGNRPQCCTAKDKGRSIIRSVDSAAVTDFKTKMETEQAKAIYRQRAQIAEFPNAWIKAKFGLRQFRLCGLIKVGIESLWACLAYNFMRYMGCLRTA
jgi:transposase